MSAGGALSGLRGVVTGAGSGLGRATAEQLLDTGADVSGWDVYPGFLDWITQHPGGSAVPVDVTDAAQVTAAAAAARDRLGRVDFVVNSAGVFLLGSLADVDPAAVSKLFAVNVGGTTAVTQALLPDLVAARGAVVNLASTVGLRASATNGHYAASKAAIAHLTRCWALELAPHGVRVNAVAPGPTPTGIYAAAGMDPAAVTELITTRATSSVPLGRTGDPAEVAAWICRLVPDGWVTGQVIAVDGGMSVA